MTQSLFRRTFALMLLTALPALFGCSGEPGDEAYLGQRTAAVTTVGSWEGTPVRDGVYSTVKCQGYREPGDYLYIMLTLVTAAAQTSVTIDDMNVNGYWFSHEGYFSSPLTRGQPYRVYSYSGEEVFDITITVNVDTRADLTIALSAPVLTMGTWSGSIDCASTVLTYVAPTASDVAVSGTAYVGSTLTGSYKFGDVASMTESGSTYQWYRVASGVSTAIPGATSQTYTPTGADTNNAVKFCVRPADASRTGPKACSPEVLVPGVLWYTGPSQTGDEHPMISTNGQCVTMGYSGTDFPANSARLDGQFSGGTTLQMFLLPNCSGPVYTRSASANTAHAIDLATVGIGNNMHSYKITW